VAIFKNETIRGERVILDGNIYDGCTLENCEIVYCGGEVRLNFSTRNCRWTFEGAALRTITVLQHLNMLPKDSSTLLAIPNAGINKKRAN